MLAIKGIITTTSKFRVIMRFHSSQIKRVIDEVKQWIRFYIDNGDEIDDDSYDLVCIYCDDNEEYLICLDDNEWW